MRRRQPVYLDGSTPPDVGAILLDPHGLTWRVTKRIDDADAQEVVLNGGYSYRMVVATKRMDGWEVL